MPDLLHAHPQTHDLRWLGDLLTWTVILLAVVGVGAGIVWLWRHRWRRPPLPVARDFDVLPDVAALWAAVTREAGAALDTMPEGSPRNAIVRCWLRLEDSVAEAGLPREPWETSAEFTLHVLKALDVDPRAISALARLYREARFSAHELGEDSRTAARAALHQLHEDLREGRAAELGRSS